MIRALTAFVLAVGLFGRSAAQLSTCCQNCMKTGYSQSSCNQRINAFQYFRCPTPTTCDLAAYDRYDSTLVGPYGMCSVCPSNFFRPPLTTQCYCTKCSTGDCPANQYIQAACTESADRVCGTCGTCGVGQETDVACGGASNIVCRACAAGKYRDQAVVNTQTSCADCRTCSTSRRERRTGCYASTNEQCPQCDAGNIVILDMGGTADSCQTCGTGKYARASDNTCATCKDCLRTERQATDCMASGDRTCVSCGGNMYTLALNAVTCAGCVADYYRTGAQSCAVCAESSCGFGYSRTCSFTVAGGGVRDCTACQGQTEAFSTRCNAGYGVDTRCDGQGIANVACAPCAAGKERPDGTALIGNIQTCIPCGLGYYKSATGAGACTACTNKPASNTQYVSWATLTPIANACPW